VVSSALERRAGGAGKFLAFITVEGFPLRVLVVGAIHAVQLPPPLVCVTNRPPRRLARPNAVIVKPGRITPLVGRSKPQSIVLLPKRGLPPQAIACL